MSTGGVADESDWGPISEVVEASEHAAARGARTGPSTVGTGPGEHVAARVPELSLEGEAVGPTDGSPPTGPAEEPSTPLGLGPWTHANNRRDPR